MQRVRRRGDREDVDARVANRMKAIPDFRRAFRDGEKFDDFYVYCHSLGAVSFPTGRIVACDPLVFSEQPPFRKKVTPGRYPVLLCVACYRDSKETDKHVAAAMLQFTPRKGSPVGSLRLPPAKPCESSPRTISTATQWILEPAASWIETPLLL